MSRLFGKCTIRDRHAKAEATADEKFDDFYDIQHVKHKFGSAKAGSWLLERLGKAITKRRQYFRYCRTHREKLANAAVPAISRNDRTCNVDTGTENDRGVKDAIPRPPTLTPTRPSLVRTTASTLGPVDLNVWESGIDDGSSTTTAATSVTGDNELTLLSVPPLLDFASPGQEFECPYCYTIQKFNGQRGWKKHVFGDIQPYVCTFEDCGLLMFEDRRTWADHEMENHRRDLVCQICGTERIHSALGLSAHIRQTHRIDLNERQLDILLLTCSRPKELFSAQSCMLCDWEPKLRATGSAASDHEETFVNPQRFAKHLASHLEQIALFSLPQNCSAEAATNQAEAGAELSDWSLSISVCDRFLMSTSSKASGLKKSRGISPIIRNCHARQLPKMHKRN